MNHNKELHKKVNLILLEMIIVIFFTTVSLLILIGVFVKAKEISRESSIKQESLLVVEGIIEEWKRDPSVMMGNKLEEDEYKVEIHRKMDEELYYIRLVVVDNRTEKELYEVETRAYVGE